MDDVKSKEKLIAMLELEIECKEEEIKSMSQRLNENVSQKSSKHELDANFSEMLKLQIKNNEEKHMMSATQKWKKRFMQHLN